MSGKRKTSEEGGTMIKKIRNKIAIILTVLAVVCFGLGVFFQFDTVHAQSTVGVLDGFLMDETASVRRLAPVGIRFTVNLDEETRRVYDRLGENGGDLEIGSILLPEHMLGNEELTLPK